VLATIDDYYELEVQAKRELVEVWYTSELDVHRLDKESHIVIADHPGDKPFRDRDLYLESFGVRPFRG
jgi:hypothetical protein